MDIPFHLHPLELSKQISLFWENLVRDFDLRFPEGRRRRIIELSLELPDQSFPKDWQLDEFQKSELHISYLDWPMLFEWNERWQQIRTRVLVHQALNESKNREASASSKLVRIILQRLAQIETSLRTKVLHEQPSLFSLLAFRWRFAPLRDEVEYLIERLQKTID